MNLDEIAKKILKETTKEGDMLATATEWGTYGLIGAAAVIGTTGLLDVVNSHGERRETQKQQRIQERQLKEKNEKELKKQWIGLDSPPPNTVGLVQQMFNMRSGHSNTWGGVRY